MNQLWMTIVWASRRGRWEAWYDLHVCVCARSAAYNRFTHLPMIVIMSNSHCGKLTHWSIQSQHPAYHPSTASNYPSNLAQSWPPNASPNSLNNSLQVNLQSCTILDSGLWRYLQPWMITASECIPILTRPLHHSESPHSLEVRLWVLLQTRSITDLSVSPDSLDYCHEVHTSRASNCLSLNSHVHRFQVYLQSRLITASKFGRSWPPAASPTWLNHQLGVHL